MSDETLVRLAGLHARDERGAIEGLGLALPAGSLGALIGTPGDGTTALARVMSGVLVPRSGEVTIAGERPGSSPEIRRRIGSLLDDPALPDVGRVRDLLVFTRKLRGGEAPRDQWHEPFGIGALESASVTALDRRQRRTVGLALALAVESPALLVLHEPACDRAGANRDTLRTLLRARATQGACVLVLTASVGDAASLVDDVATLRRGRVDRAIGAPELDALTPGSSLELHVWSDMPRMLASALVLEPTIRAVSWDCEHGAPLVVRCVDLDAAASAVARAANSNGVAIQAIRPVVPSLGEVNAASAGLALASRYQAAWAASSQRSAPGRTP